MRHEIHSGPVIIHGTVVTNHTQDRSKVLSTPVPNSHHQSPSGATCVRLVIVCACNSRYDGEHCWYRALCESRDGGKEQEGRSTCGRPRLSLSTPRENAIFAHRARSRGCWRCARRCHPRCSGGARRRYMRCQWRRGEMSGMVN
jgi:hypothetical protein